MAMLTAVLTHLGAAAIGRQMSYLRALAPDSRFLVCHGGRRADFDQLDDDTAIFVDDPSLRGPHFEKSIAQTLAAIHDAAVRDDPSVEYLYLVEYDHLILQPDFERALRDVAEAHDAGVLGKHAGPRNDSNWPTYLKGRHDAVFDDFVRSVSRRDDPSLRLGCLGTGILLRRDALDALVSLDAPERYVEMAVPTLAWHLGFEVVDVDAVADLYMAVRWLPELSVAEAVAAKRAGRAFAHPFKRLEALDVVARAPGPQNSSTSGRSG